jgi:hypothetical protein
MSSTVPIDAEEVGRSGNGAGYKVRTRDPLITNQVLYQLS